MIDQVLCSTVQADNITPGLAPMVAHRIGATRAGGTDMNAACAGFVYALDHAAAMIETGRARHVLVIGAEALSRITDPADRGTAVLFADGAGAAIVAGGDYERGLAGFDLHCAGEHGGLLYADIDDRFLRMEGAEVYRHAVARMAESTRVMLERTGLSADDIDLFVAHQANARIIEAAAARARARHGQGVRQRRHGRQHLVGLDPARAGPGRGRGPPAPRRHGRAGRIRCGLRVGRRDHDLEGDALVSPRDGRLRRGHRRQPRHRRRDRGAPARRRLQGRDGQPQRAARRPAT